MDKNAISIKELIQKTQENLSVIYETDFSNPSPSSCITNSFVQFLNSSYILFVVPEQKYLNKIKSFNLPSLGNIDAESFLKEKSNCMKKKKHNRTKAIPGKYKDEDNNLRESLKSLRNSLAHAQFVFLEEKGKIKYIVLTDYTSRKDDIVALKFKFKIDEFEGFIMDFVKNVIDNKII